MKKIFFIALLLVFTKSKAQQTTPPCNWDPSWDWLNSIPSNWNAQIQGTIAYMGSPFVQGGSSDITSINNASDYLPQQGWVLLKKDFGCIGAQDVSYATPYFILYNKYRGLMRLFIYVGNSNQNSQGAVAVQWFLPSDNNSLLTLANNYPHANEDYPLGNNKETLLNYLNEYPNTGGWIVTDFNVNFDPNTSPTSVFQGFDFKITPSSTANVALSGEFQFTTQSGTVKNSGTPTTNPSDNTLLDYIATGKSFLGKVPTRSDLESGFNDVAAGVNSVDEQFCNDFTRDLHNVNYELQNGDLKKYLLGASDLAKSAGGALSIAASVLEMFIGKSNSASSGNSETYIQPTISKGTIKLNGTITTSSSPKKIHMQLPGVKHTYINGNENWDGMPIYDCPLGVLSVQKLPTVSLRNYNKVVTTGTITGESDWWATGQYFTCYSVHEFTEDYKSYKIDGNLELSLNDAAGVYIESAKACIVGEVGKLANGTKAYDLFSEEYAYYPNPYSLCNLAYVYLTHPEIGDPDAYQNATLNLLRNGTYKINEFSPDGFHKFSTPFVDIEKFKNTSFTVRSNTKVYIKILVTMRPTDPNADQTPIVNVFTYELPSNKLAADAGTSDFPFTCNQKEELTTGDNLISGPINIEYGLYQGIYVQTANGVNVTTSNIARSYVNFEGTSRVQMNPGFKATVYGEGGFSAYINPANGFCEQGQNALQVVHYFTNCTPNPFARLANGDNQSQRAFKNTESSKEIVSSNIGIKMYIAPNPNNGNFKLIFNQNVNVGKIKITNMLGEVITTIDTDYSSLTEIELITKLQQGTYLLTFYNNEFTLNQKFIVE